MVLLSKFKRVFLKVFGVRKKAWLWALLTSTLLGLGLISFKSCGPSEDENYPGLCPLNCDGAAILPPGEYEIQPLVAGQGGIDIECRPNYESEAINEDGWQQISGDPDKLRGEMAQRISVLSRIGAKSRPFPNAQLLKFKIVAVGGSGEGEDAGGVRGQLGIDVTVGGEGVSGGFPLANTRVNLSTSGSSVWNASVNKVKKEDTEYQGIATPPEYWCTDSCGVLSIKLNLICPPLEAKYGGQLNISSGSIAHSVEIGVSNVYELPELPEEPEDDDNNNNNNNGNDGGENGGGGSGGDGSGGGGSGGGGSGGGGDSGS